MDTFISGMSTFESLYTAHECKILRDAYDAISQCQLWDWMQTYTPHANDGDQHPNLLLIREHMTYTGVLWAWTMRIMQKIAKAGGVEAYIETQPFACECRLAQGYTRGWCGVAGGGVPGCEH